MTDGPLPTIKGPARCPDCGAYCDFAFGIPITDIPAMYVDDEWVSVGEFPARVYCRECPWRQEVIGWQFTIDIKAGRITYGRMRPSDDH